MSLPNSNSNSNSSSSQATNSKKADHAGERSDRNATQPSDLPAEGSYLNRVVVGEIIAVNTILQSSGLKDITVDCGDRAYRTVSTTNDVQVGMKTAFALLGAKLRNDYVQIREISGVESHGRLCTNEDLGLRNHPESIIRFPPHLKNGLRLEELVN